MRIARKDVFRAARFHAKASPSRLQPRRTELRPQRGTRAFVTTLALGLGSATAFLLGARGDLEAPPHPIPKDTASLRPTDRAAAYLCEDTLIRTPIHPE